MHALRLLVLLPALLLATACSYSRASRVPLWRAAATEEQREVARLARTRGDALSEEVRLQPLLKSAKQHWAALEELPDDVATRQNYNFAVGRVIEWIEASGLKPWETPVPISSRSELTLTVPSLPPGLTASDFAFLPADRYRFRGSHVQNRSVRNGIGAPLIAVGRDGRFIERDPFAQGETVYQGLTALLRFEGGNVHLEVLDPLDFTSVALHGRRFPLAADFSAPTALLLSEVNVRRMQLGRLFRPDLHADATRLARLQPYDPARVPVLFIHGLGNSPATFVPLVTELWADPVLRQRYQFWFFSHPSGVPYSISTAELRTQLDELRRRYPESRDLVVIGHSMGGMISRLLMTEPGTALWDAHFDQAPDEIGFSEATREAVTRVLLFEPRPDVARVILVSASLRGSEKATSFLGRLGARLIGDPFPDSEISRELLAYSREESGLGRRRLPNSIEILDPDSHWLSVVNRLPLDRSVPFHSLMGDRGRGGHLDRRRPESSDGIVSYWSAHLEGVQSERIVPSGHWSHLHPEGMAEIRRILLEHLEE